MKEIIYDFAINLAMILIRLCLYADILWISFNVAALIVLGAPFNYWSLLPVPIITGLYIAMIVFFTAEFVEELNEQVEK